MYKRVVVPLDGSAVAESVLGFILQIAGPLDFEVTLLRVVPSTESDTASAEAAPYLEKVAAELAAKGVRVRTQVRLGNPAAEIVRAARELGADLVAMTTGGRGGLGRMLLGSVAETVLRTADVPLFLFRHVGRPAA